MGTSIDDEVPANGHVLDLGVSMIDMVSLGRAVGNRGHRREPVTGSGIYGRTTQTKALKRKYGWGVRRRGILGSFFCFFRGPSREGRQTLLTLLELGVGLQGRGRRVARGGSGLRDPVVCTTLVCHASRPQAHRQLPIRTTGEFSLEWARREQWTEAPSRELLT